jgi:anti-sigma factor ChrR (cupin superfamily)
MRFLSARGEQLRYPCPDLQTIAAYLEGKLTRDEQLLIETHLSQCARCRKIVSLAIKTEKEVPPPTPPDSNDS